MKAEIKIPAMGESISEATVGTILKPSGSQVKVDDELLELETDKVNQLLYAPEAGVLSLTVSQGDVVTIDQVIGYIDTEGKEEGKGEVRSKKDEVKSGEAEEGREAAAPSVAHTQQRRDSTGMEREPTLSTRKTKEAFLEELQQEKDPAAKERKPAPIPVRVEAAGPETRKKMSTIRKVIAARLVEAQQTTAMLTTFNEVDMSKVMALREKYKETFLKEHGVKLGFMSFFVKASVSALKTFPEINSYIDGDDIVHRDYYHIGIAVATERGLVVPVVRYCDQLAFAEIEQVIENLAQKAREGTLSIDDLQGGGFTITNGGVFGSLLSTPILNIPQSGILGMHKIVKRPVVVEDQIVIRPMMYVALSYDHRIVDGKEAVSFLVHLKGCLEDPSKWLLEL